MTSAPAAPQLRLLVFSASLRADSWNHRLAALAARAAERSGARVDYASMSDFQVPAYDGDLEAKQGIAAGEIGDEALRGRFEKNLQAFLSLAEAAKNYPCIQRAWVEFLGEPPGAGEDRVDPVTS